jgi:hypothetical protein
MRRATTLAVVLLFGLALKAQDFLKAQYLSSFSGTAERCQCTGTFDQPANCYALVGASSCSIPYAHFHCTTADMVEATCRACYSGCSGNNPLDLASCSTECFYGIRSVKASGYNICSESYRATSRNCPVDPGYSSCPRDQCLVACK